MNAIVNKYDAKFEKAFVELIDNEGGYVNNPKDPGGETKFGISKRSYPHLNIKDLTLEDAKEIYYNDFWLKVNGPNLLYALGYEMFDAAVNHGIRRAVKILQKAVRIIDDGVAGPKTMAAVTSQDHNDTLFRYNAYRLKYFTSLQTFDEFGRGWSNRIADNLLRAAENN